MKREINDYADSSTYPGAYVPLFRETDVQQMIKLSREFKTLPHPVNITQNDDAYRIEVAMPGIERENILLLAHANTISVIVMKTASAVPEGEIFLQHEFDGDCFSHHINIAEDADVEFSNAVCHSGMLQIYIPKSTTNSVSKGPLNIAIY